MVRPTAFTYRSVRSSRLDSARAWRSHGLRVRCPHGVRVKTDGCSAIAMYTQGSKSGRS